MRREKYEPSGKLLTSTAMAAMREAAFGMEQRVHTFKTMDKAEKMRDDDALLKAAEEKRKRKAARRLAVSGRES